MSKDKKKRPQVKAKMHANNRHRERYDFKKLVETSPALADFVKPNKYGDDSIDFADPKAVRLLNTALLMHYYDLEFYEIPEGYLCPPVPGRADYMHHVSDLLSAVNFGKVPQGESIRVLDIGVGANCIYPIVGIKEFGWSFIGSEIDETALASAKKIVESNPNLKEKVDLRLQSNKRDILHGIIQKDDRVELVICNPPFHASAEDAMAAASRKVNNLKRTDHKGFRKKKEEKKPVLNFGGQSNELWVEGGEKRFLSDMIKSSKKFPECAYWYTALVSKENTLRGMYEALRAAGVTDVRTIPMGTGNKTSRIVAWTFLTREAQRTWANKRIRSEADIQKAKPIDLELPQRTTRDLRRGKELVMPNRPVEIEEEEFTVPNKPTGLKGKKLVMPNRPTETKSKVSTPPEKSSEIGGKELIMPNKTTGVKGKELIMPNKTIEVKDKEIIESEKPTEIKGKELIMPNKTVEVKDKEIIESEKPTEVKGKELKK